MSDVESKLDSGGHSGRNGPFSKAQIQLIERSLPAWHEFSLTHNPEIEGRGYQAKLTNWKKTEAKRILRLQEFGSIPEHVSHLLAYHDYQSTYRTGSSVVL